MNNEFKFRDLNAYKKARILVVEVYKLLEAYPSKEQYAICDQLRRAVVSVPSNIAEGMGRFSIKEQIHFIEIAYGSLMEVLSQLDVSLDLGYISQSQLDNVESIIVDVAKLLSGLRNSLNSKLTQNG